MIALPSHLASAHAFLLSTLTKVAEPQGFCPQALPALPRLREPRGSYTLQQPLRTQTQHGAPSQQRLPQTFPTSQTPTFSASTYIQWLPEIQDDCCLLHSHRMDTPSQTQPKHYPHPTFDETRSSLAIDRLNRDHHKHFPTHKHHLFPLPHEISGHFRHTTPMFTDQRRMEPATHRWPFMRYAPVRNRRLHACMFTVHPPSSITG